jgi:hypothetical protein
MRSQLVLGENRVRYDRNLVLLQKSTLTTATANVSFGVVAAIASVPQLGGTVASPWPVCLQGSSLADRMPILMACVLDSLMIWLYQVQRSTCTVLRNSQIACVFCRNGSGRTALASPACPITVSR